MKNQDSLIRISMPSFFIVANGEFNKRLEKNLLTLTLSRENTVAFSIEIE